MNRGARARLKFSTSRARAIRVEWRQLGRGATRNGSRRFVTMIVIHTGEGKGKTTAALGAALRAVGGGKRVLMIQFIKGPWKSGEDEAAKLLSPYFEIRKMGRGFVGILGDALPRSAHEAAAREAFECAKTETESGFWDVLMLDELNVALEIGLIDLKEVVKFAAGFPKDRQLWLTGRAAPAELVALADTVTEMKEIKHAFQKGESAERGVEY